MGWYFFYQTNPNEPWVAAEAEKRAEIIRQRQPFLTTVLDVDRTFIEDEDGNIDPAEKHKAKYRGPLYFDFDGDIQDALQDAQTAVRDLERLDVDPACIDIFATGGRGFHLEVPLECAVSLQKGQGYTRLPLINKEIAYDLATPTLDLRVYSTGKGRMWRTPNVRRDNGRYKVPITLDELMTMTPEKYVEITSHPRPPLARATPELASRLSGKWTVAVDKLAKTPKRASKLDAKLVQTWNKDWPPSVRKILAGEGVVAGHGFQRIAMQLAITAHAIGKTSDQLLEDAEGLCQTYRGNSDRYGTEGKRKRELVRMWYYFDEHPGYAFQVAPLRAIIDPEIPTPDLTSMATVPMTQEDIEENIEPYKGVMAVRGGIFIEKDGIQHKVCDAGISNPVIIYNLDGTVAGCSVGVWYGNKQEKEVELWIADLQSRAKLQNVLAANLMCSLDLSDIQTGYLMDHLRVLSRKQKRDTYIVESEGMHVLDLPKLPGQDEPPGRDVVWISPYGHVSRRDVEAQERPDEETAQPFRYVMKTAQKTAPVYSSDLMLAPKWRVDVDERAATEFLDKFLVLNERQSIAKLIGWYSACHWADWFRSACQGQFPLAHVFGEAGSGKTTLARLFYHLHCWTGGGGSIHIGSAISSPFALQTAISSSRSIPFIMDEMKPREMSSKHADFVRMLLRNAFTAAAQQKGHVDRTSSMSTLQVISTKLTAPIIYISEAQEMQTALLHRSVPIPLDVMGKHRGRAIDHCTSTASEVLSPIGKDLAILSLRTDRQLFREELSDCLSSVRQYLGDDSEAEADDRLVFGYSAVLYGLRRFRDVVRTKMGDKYDEIFKDMEDSLAIRPTSKKYTEEEDAAWQPMSGHVTMPRNEMAQVLSHMALLSTMNAEEDRFYLAEGRHYYCDPEAGYLDLRVQQAFVMYVQFVRAMGAVPLYDTEPAFLVAVRRYRGVMAVNPGNSPLLRTYGAGGVIVRLSLNHLNRDGVSQFNVS